MIPFLFTLIFSDTIEAEIIDNDSSREMLDLKIKSFLDEQVYIDNKPYIETILSSKSAYIINDRVDAVKVVRKLKDDGLLDLFFDKIRKTSSFKDNSFTNNPDNRKLLTKILKEVIETEETNKESIKI